MKWIDRRQKGWIPRKPTTARSNSKEPAVMPVRIASPVQLAPVIVPAFPAFSPAAVAHLLVVHRSTVHYWMANGKLDFYRDIIQERYILRAELIRFIREYLQRQVVENQAE